MGRSMCVDERKPSRRMAGSLGCEENFGRGDPAIRTSEVEKALDGLVWIGPHHGCDQLQRLGHQALYLGDHLLDDVASLVDAGTEHADGKLQMRSAASHGG